MSNYEIDRLTKEIEQLRVDIKSETKIINDITKKNTSLLKKGPRRKVIATEAT